MIDRTWRCIKWIFRKYLIAIIIVAAWASVAIGYVAVVQDRDQRRFDLCQQNEGTKRALRRVLLLIQPIAIPYSDAKLYEQAWREAAPADCERFRD